MFNFLQHACIYQVVLMIEQLFSSLFQNGKRRIILIYTTSLQKQAKEAEDTAFLGSCTLFKLAESGLIQVIQLSIPFYIDNSHLFHTFFSFHIFLVPIQYHCILSLLCVVPVACRFVYYSENNLLIFYKSTYGNYNLQTMFLQLEILRY